MKNTIRLIGIIAFIAVIGFTMAGCGEKDTEMEFNITIRNTSGYPITAYGVRTAGGLAGPEYDFNYISSGYVRGILRVDSYTTIRNLPAINLAAGATSGNLGPFKVVFRADRANPSDVEVEINYTNGTTQSSYWGAPEHPSHPSTGWGGYYEEEFPSNIKLVFDGTSLTREN
jgi:hypothetical protein